MKRRMQAFVLAGFIAASVLPWCARAWDVACETSPGVQCADTFSIAQTFWDVLPHAEHRALLDTTMGLAGLPPSLHDKFTLNVFATDDALIGENGAVYPSVRPVLVDAARRRSREMSIPGMANLPDFSYALWDLAAGNELCPPDPSSTDALDCHNYKTHIGWLNSNHMLPQSRRWYEHLHALALTQAAECRRQTEAIPLLLRDRYKPYLLACEKQALMLEGVGHHYLQDSWSVGHLWERWGGTEEADFDGDRALGFAVAGFTGLIHGAKAVLDDEIPSRKPWDDPMCAPHENVTYVDKGGTPVEQHAGAGDIFLPALTGIGPVAAGDRFAPQRRALFGCAVDGIRAVYAATGQVHGPLGDPQDAEFDSLRSVGDDSCWAQRATNKAIAEGCGIHRGEAPDTVRVLPAENAGPLGMAAATQPLVMAELTIIAYLAGAPISMNPLTHIRFQADASWTCALAVATAIDPQHSDGTELAEGGLPALAGIKPNHFYARGDPARQILPAFWADPFPPWSVDDSAFENAPRERVLNLFFADANAAERCGNFSTADLEQYVAAVDQARTAGADALTVDARCGQCVQLIAPHLRHGVAGGHDERREAFCGIVAPNDAAFVYTGEDQVSFTGAEPLTFAGLQEAARVKCGCDPGECGNGTLCIGTCVDLHSDPGNCGSCGHACAGGQACDAGTCIDTCEGADLQTDEANCGSCGDECGYGEECVSGICKRVCPSPYDGGAAYYVSYPCDSVRCNCQLEVCISGACRAWSGPYETEAIHGRFIPDPLPPKPTDGYCPTSHPFASRTLNLQSVFGFRCCDYYQTDCVCPLGVGSVMETDGYCYPAEE